MARASTAQTELSHNELTSPRAKNPVKAVWKLDRVNHWVPWESSRGEMAVIRNSRMGTMSNRASTSHSTTERAMLGNRNATR